MNTTTTSEAVTYRSRGWHPIPIKVGSKQTSLPKLAPYLSKAATEEEFGSWTWPGVGIVTGILSGIVVLDADGPEGEAELRCRGHGMTPMAKTPGGGTHVYLRHPGVQVPTMIRIVPGIDLKAAGGYVVAPPSIGRNGKRYEWIVSPAEAEPADLPEWLARILKRPHRRIGAAPVGERIPSGNRNKELTSLAGSMRRRGMGEAEIRAALEATNERRCDPPLEEEEVGEIARSVARYEPEVGGVSPGVNGSGPGKLTDRFNLTDLGNAERFVASHGEDLRYCYPWRKWLVWTGCRWERDESGMVHRLAKTTVRGIYQEAAAAEDEAERKALAGHAARSEAEPKIRAMLELAKSERPISPDELDVDSWLLNAPNGTVDLRTGKMREHRREDLLMKMAGAEYDADAEAPAWDTFFGRVMSGEELRLFVQRATGYSATGDTSEQCMFINYGAGANGKSTFQEVLAAALGDYAMRTPTETLLAKRAGGVPNDVARLKGARFVAASESEEGRHLAESLVKELTGQDTISARYMRAEWFEFRPTHKLWLSTNHRPEIRGTDNAIWRRIRLIPWTVQIPPTDQDHKLPEKLRAELPGILAWVVQGCLGWQRGGLRPPDEVTRATVEYRAEMDVLAAFLGDCCELRGDGWTYARDLYRAYRWWCMETGERPESQKRLGGRLRDRGYTSRRGGDRGAALYDGLLLTEEVRSASEGSQIPQRPPVGKQPPDPY